MLLQTELDSSFSTSDNEQVPDENVDNKILPNENGYYEILSNGKWLWYNNKDYRWWRRNWLIWKCWWKLDLMKFATVGEIPFL